MKTDTGLVLEGGGMRGIYTAGVLDVFLENNIHFPYVIGVSAGANNGANFLSKQKERSKRILIKHSQDDRYKGMDRLVKEGNYISLKFLFETLPEKLDPFDYNTFKKNSTLFKVGVTDCKSGKAEYFTQKDYDSDFFMKKILRASSSLPLISQPVSINNKKYIDGGIAAPIPVNKAIKDNYDYNVLILTRHKDYRKTPSTMRYIYRLYYRNYPQLIDCLINRHKNYNKSMDYINKLEEKNKVFVFRPEKKIKISRLETDQEKLTELYNQAYKETINKLDDFKNWLNNIKTKAVSN